MAYTKEYYDLIRSQPLRILAPKACASAVQRAHVTCKHRVGAELSCEKLLVLNSQGPNPGSLSVGHETAVESGGRSRTRREPGPSRLTSHKAVCQTNSLDGGRREGTNCNHCFGVCWQDCCIAVCDMISIRRKAREPAHLAVHVYLKYYLHRCPFLSACLVHVCPLQTNEEILIFHTVASPTVASTSTGSHIRTLQQLAAVVTLQPRCGNLRMPPCASRAAISSSPSPYLAPGP